MSTIVTVGIDCDLPHEVQYQSYEKRNDVLHQRECPGFVKSLFGIKGVLSVQFHPYEIVLEKALPFSWDELIWEVCRVLHLYCAPEEIMGEISSPLHRFFDIRTNYFSDRVDPNPHYVLFHDPPLYSTLMRSKRSDSSS
ncbi:MAG: hypothetical protein KGI50_01475 [Patescibacteria group bacterium]|nr:hypothetical protein [Patescibacteria group bacterium]